MMIFWGEFQCVVSYHFKKKKIEYGSKSKSSPHLKNQRNAFPIWESSLLLRSPKCFFCTASHFFALLAIIAIVQMWRACSSDGRLEQCGLTREKSAGNPSGLCISIWKVQNTPSSCSVHAQLHASSATTNESSWTQCNTLCADEAAQCTRNSGRGSGTSWWTLRAAFPRKGLKGSPCVSSWNQTDWKERTLYHKFQIFNLSVIFTSFSNTYLIFVSQKY